MIIPTFFVQGIFTRTTDTGGTLIRFHRYFCIMIFSETLPQQISTSLLLLFLQVELLVHLEVRTNSFLQLIPNRHNFPAYR